MNIAKSWHHIAVITSRPLVHLTIEHKFCDEQVNRGHLYLPCMQYPRIHISYIQVPIHLSCEPFAFNDII